MTRSYLRQYAKIARLRFSHLLRIRESNLIQKASENVPRVQLARSGPGNELGHINTTVAGLAVVDPTLRLFQAFAQVPLGEARFLS